MANYEIDTLVRLSVTFTTVIGNMQTDPSDVTIYIKPPGASVTLYTYSGSQVAKDTTGMYHYDLLVNAIGSWAYKWQATGAVVVTSPDVLLVCNPTLFVPPLP